MESSGTAGSWLDTKQTGHVSLQFTTRNDTGGTATCIVLTMFATSPNIRQQVMKPIFFPVSKYIYECVYIYMCVCGKQPLHDETWIHWIWHYDLIHSDHHDMTCDGLWWSDMLLHMDVSMAVCGTTGRFGSTSATCSLQIRQSAPNPQPCCVNLCSIQVSTGDPI